MKRDDHPAQSLHRADLDQARLNPTRVGPNPKKRDRLPPAGTDSRASWTVCRLNVYTDEGRVFEIDGAFRESWAVEVRIGRRSIMEFGLRLPEHWQSRLDDDGSHDTDLYWLARKQACLRSTERQASRSPRHGSRTSSGSSTRCASAHSPSLSERPLPAGRQAG